MDGRADRDRGLALLPARAAPAVVCATLAAVAAAAAAFVVVLAVASALFAPAVPPTVSALTAAITSFACTASSPVVGSSRKSTRGSPTSATPMLTRLFRFNIFWFFVFRIFCAMSAF